MDIIKINNAIITIYSETGIYEINFDSCFLQYASKNMLAVNVLIAISSDKWQVSLFERVIVV